VTSLDVGLPEPLKLTLKHGRDEATITALFPAPRWAGHLAAAAAAGVAMGLPLRIVAERLSGAEPDLYKDSIHKLEDGSMIILDCFKASFWTLPSSFEVLQSATAPRKTFVLGTLSDYRGSPRSRYSEAARGALEVADRVLAYGPHAYRLKRMLPDNPDRLFLFESFAELATYIDATATPGEVIHVKSSSIDHLERLMHRKRKPILCYEDKCGISLRSCNFCKRLYGRKPSRAEALALR
jgi:UDP-N-acetylmuramyl pentapeptide synthase